MSNSSQKSPIVQLALSGIVLLALSYVYTGTTWVGRYVADLPVQGRQEAKADEPSRAAPEPRKTLHPLLVESKSKASALQLDASLKAQQAAGLDTVFGLADAERAKKEEEAAKEAARKAAEREKAAAAAAAAAAASRAAAAPGIAMPVIDFFGAMRARVELQALTPNGAIINDRYVETGDTIEALAYPDAKTGKAVSPRLAAVDAKGVTIAEPNGVRRFKVTFP